MCHSLRLGIGAAETAGKLFGNLTGSPFPSINSWASLFVGLWKTKNSAILGIQAESTQL